MWTSYEVDSICRVVSALELPQVKKWPATEQPHCENQAKMSFSHLITVLKYFIVALSRLDTIRVM